METVTEYQSRPLSEVVDIVSGFGFPKELQGKLNGDLPFFKVGDISIAWNSGQKSLAQAQNYLNNAEASAIKARSFPKGTVVFAKIGETIKLNRRAVLGQPSLVDNNVMGLIPKKGIVDSNYLFYWTLTLRLGDISQATTVPSVRKSDVQQLAFPWLPVDQQKRIVAEIEKQFSRLDEAVANLKRYKAAVLKAAVEGRLVETEAELARREGRSYETGEQLLQRILDTRRRQWQGKGKYKEPAAPDTTDLPELPEGWVWATVDSVCEQIVDCPHSTPRFQGGGLPCIDTTWMTTEGLVIERARYVDDATYKKRNARLEPKAGDIIFAREGTIGTAVQIPQGMRSCLGQRVMLLRSSEPFLAGLLRHVLHSETVKRQYRVQSLGSTVAHINVRDVKTFKVPVPPLAEQKRIVEEVDRRLSIVHEIEAEIDANHKRGQALRQTVLASMFVMECEA